MLIRNAQSCILNVMYMTYADIDECESGTHNCSSGGDAPAQCINLPGDFRCSCDQDDEYTLSTSDYATCVGEPFRKYIISINCV